MKNKSFIFYFLLFLTFLGFIFAGVYLNLNNTAGKFQFKPYDTVTVNIENSIACQNEVLLKADNDFILFKKNKNVLTSAVVGNIKTLDILIKKGYENQTGGIFIFNNSGVHYFKNLSSFEKKETKDGFIQYKIPDFLKTKENSYTFISNLNILTETLLSFFSFSYLLIIPYLFLFFTIIYFINHKDEIKKIKINGFVIFAFILLIGILLRKNGLFNSLPWLDEYFSIYFSHPSKDITYVLEDAGNPPLFYLLFRLYLSIFQISLVSIKLFPFFCGVFSVILLWFLLYKIFDLKIANTGAFLASINFPLIYFSCEVRSYIFQAALVPVIIYILFKIINTNKPKYYFIYFVSVILASNLHYYMIFFLFSNFIYVNFVFIKEKRFNDILKFFNANLFGILPFFCYFNLTSNEFALQNSGFNDWIEPVDFNVIKSSISYIFGSLTSFLLSGIFFFKNKKSRYVSYSFFVLITVFLFSFIFSVFVRPITVEKYFTFLIPVFIFFLMSVFYLNYKNKYFIILFIFWCLLIQNPVYEKGFDPTGVIEYPLQSSYQYIKTAPLNENIYVITNVSKEDFSFGHQNYLSDKINYESVMALSFEDTVNEILKSDKNAVIFTTLLNPDKIKGKTLRYYESGYKNGLYKIQN